MRKTFLSLALVVVSFLGILDTSYLTYEKVTGQFPRCSVSFKCEKVLTSSWSHIGPIPLSVLGMVFYLVFFCVSSVHFLVPKEKLEHFLLLQSTIGVGVSLCMIGIMGFILQAWCLFCLFSATTSILLFMISSSVFIQGRKKYEPSI